MWITSGASNRRIPKIVQVVRFQRLDPRGFGAVLGSLVGGPADALEY
jgi:hypothetical protein